MVMKGYSAFLKASVLQGPYHQIVISYLGHSLWGMSYFSAEMQSVYSAAPVDWAK